MKNCLKLIALLVCTASIAHSQPGSPAAGVPASAPCLTIGQRVRLGDSLAMLPKVRRAAIEYRTAVEIAQRHSAGLSTALVAQQGLTTRAHRESKQWKEKARRRGLLNWIFTAIAGGAAYHFVHQAF